MFDPSSGRNIWVAPTPSNREDGTREAPFSSVRTAVDAAQPGSVVVLTAGEYSESVTIQERSGEETSPITIMADPSAEAVILHREWYFYEVSDFIVKGLTFVETPNTALSLVGSSKRNIFKECLFINCGENAECTLFFGGSGGEFNVIENCQFTRSGEGTNRAVLIAQSCDSEDPSSRISTNTVIRSSVFENYTTAVILGSGDEIVEPGNHLVCENLFTGCGEGVRIKAAAVDLRDNIFRECSTAVSQADGPECEISNNRFESCTVGIALNSQDTTVTDNCLINAPITVTAAEELVLPTIISGNSFIFTEPTPAVAVTGAETPLSVIISDNLIFSGSLTPHPSVKLHENRLFSPGEITFLNAAEGDFRTSESAGCHTAAAFRTAIDPIPQADLPSHGIDTDGDDAVPEMDERDLYLKSLFVMNEDDLDENPEEPEDDGSDDGEFYDYED